MNDTISFWTSVHCCISDDLFSLFLSLWKCHDFKSWLGATGKYNTRTIRSLSHACCAGDVFQNAHSKKKVSLLNKPPLIYASISFLPILANLCKNIWHYLPLKKGPWMKMWLLFIDQDRVHDFICESELEILHFNAIVINYS